jgi:hypothetical protein
MYSIIWFFKNLDNVYVFVVEMSGQTTFDLEREYNEIEENDEWRRIYNVTHNFNNYLNKPRVDMYLFFFHSHHKYRMSAIRAFHAQTASTHKI